jgi:hypothetical protein
MGLLAFGSGSTLNATVAPDGATTADLVTEDLSTSEHRIETAAISWAANTTYTLTMFAKANGRTRMDFFGIGGGNFTGGREADFNLLTGSVISTDGSTASITPFPNGWYRLRMTFTTSAAPSASPVFIRLNDNSSNFSYTGDGTSGIYVWGAQLETGAFPTSYIPTTGATATRSADLASVTGSNFSSWYRQDEGTVFASPSTINAAYTSGVIWDIGAGGAFGSTAYCTWSGTQWGLNPNVSPLNLLSAITAPALSTNASALQSNNSVISASGLIAGVDSSCSMPSNPTTLSIGRAGWTSGNFFNGTIRRLTYWPQRLPNNTLIALTR